jgi:phosphatidylglycerophosphate synthase
MLVIPRKRQIPWAMASGRVLIGPLLILGAILGWNGILLASLVVIALLSDIFDGILARRWSCDTAAVRLYDSMADTVFYLCTAVAVWIEQPRLFHTYGRLLLVLLALEILRFVLDFSKFGRPASYHSYLSKFWSLILAGAIVSIFALHRFNQLVTTALVLGILSDLEGLGMSLILPVWTRDVKTLHTAWLIRKRVLAGTPPAAHVY